MPADEIVQVVVELGVEVIKEGPPKRNRFLLVLWWLFVLAVLSAIGFVVYAFLG